MTAPTVTRLPRATDTFRWRLAIGAVLIAGGYLAWLVIPLVLGSDLTPRVKTALTAFLGSTPLLTKLIAIALLGRPTINFLKKHSFKLFRRAELPIECRLASAFGSFADIRVATRVVRLVPSAVIPATAPP